MRCKTKELVEEVVEDRADCSALKKEDGYWISWNGNKTPKETTSGWQVYIMFKDGSAE